MFLPLGTFAPELSLGLVSASRNCFPRQLSQRRTEALLAACRQRGIAPVVPQGDCAIIETRAHAREAAAQLVAARCDAAVLFLGNFSPEIEDAQFVKDFPGPVMVIAAAEEAAGERVALGNCEDKNYRTIVAAALANNQLVVARTPIDVNLCKQLNILISDMRLDLTRILSDPTTGALGYGLEYTYSVIERLKLAALSGDGMTQQPMIVTAGYEAWRAKETRVNEGVPAEWGDWDKRSRLWETMTATALLEAGANIVVTRHPTTVPVLKRTINGLMNAAS